MNHITTYITDSLREIYSSPELKSLSRIICKDLLELDELDIYLHKDIKLSEKKQCLLEEVVERLRKHEPIQYVSGMAHFYGSVFYVAPGVLIPRSETEELVELVLTENSGKMRILDIGTGSGCIAITLSQNLQGAIVDAWDVSEKALAIAQKNAEQLNVDVNFYHRNVFDDCPDVEAYDVIVSNPPYVTESERKAMDKNVLDWEPETALFVSDDDPLLFYKRIAEMGLKLLLIGGRLYFEINRAYGKETVDMLQQLGYKHTRVIKDLFGNDRIVSGIK